MATQLGYFNPGATPQATFGGAKSGLTGFPNHALGVRVELLLNTTWTDITKYVLVRDDVTISSFGRSDESSTINSASLAITLKNKDGRFTPDNTSGAYYPYVQLNTQIRLSVSDRSTDGTSYSGYRFWGEVSEWPPQWDPTGNDSYATITASGIWRRISQGSQPIGSPYTRYNKYLDSSYNLVGYWPMEDGASSTSFAGLKPATSGNMTISGPPTNTPTLSSVAVFPGSDALPTLNAAEFDATISTSSSPTTNQFRFCLFVPSGGDTGRAAGAVARMHTNGTVATVDVSLGANGTGPLVVTGKNSGGTTLFTSSSTLTTWGVTLLVVVNLTHSGSNVLWTMNTILPGASNWNTTTTGSVPGSVSDVTSIIFNPGGTFNGTCVGQAAVYYGNPSILSTAQALNAWTGENALTRFTRICNEQAIPYETIGTTTTTLGPQVDDTLVNILQGIEDTDGGLLYETRDQFGIGYRTMTSLQNQSSAMTLDYNARQVGQPLSPVNDDALVRNDVTLTNYDGYSVRVFLENGARSLNPPPNGVGTGYEYTLNVSSHDHTQVNNRAIQIMNCGTVAKSRYPTITANLARTTTAPLFSKAPSMRQGDYLTVTNMPAQGGAATQKQLVWGWSETINTHTWTITYNTIPEDPWESSFNPGTTTTGQVPSVPTTQGGAGGAGSVSSAQIAEGAIIGQNLAAGSVQGGNIANATITATNIASATITGTNIASATITGSNIASGTISGTNIVAASITGTQIASGTITSTNIQAGTIVGGDIASGTITGSNIASATIVGSNIGSATITGSNIQNATITNVQIGSGTITGGNIGSSTITGSNLANATITSVQISNGTITTTQISNSAGITGTQVASGTITASNIAAATITGGLIAANTITASNIVGATITATQIAAATITGSNIAAGTITATNIAAATITGGLIAAGTITASNIAAGTITATQIAANTITAGKLVSGIVVAGIVDATTITGASIVADGSNGEILVYAGTPATGNLIGSWSANAGTDGNSNSYNAGLWIYDSGGNSMGFVPGGGSAASQLAFSVGSGTPTPPSGCSGLYGAGSGQIQYVDAYDGSTYGAGRRSLVSGSDQTVSTTGWGSLFSSQVGGTSKKYRVSGVLHIAPNQAAGYVGFRWSGPSGASGNVNFTYVQGTSISNSGGLNSGNSSGGVAIHFAGSPITPQTVYIEGSFSVTTLGTFSLDASLGIGGDTCIVRAYSSIDLMPV